MAQQRLNCGSNNYYKAAKAALFFPCYRLLVVVILLMRVPAAAQELITVKAGEDPRVLKDLIYTYPSFQEGIVYMKNGDSVTARLNYNLFEGKFHFLNGRDTLQLEDDEKTAYLVIQKDSFFFHRGFVLRMVKEHGFAQLLVNEKLRLHDEHRVGAMGMTRPTHNIDSKSSFISWQTLQLQLNRDLIFSREAFFYFHQQGKFSQVSRKNLQDLFSFAGKHVFKEYIEQFSPNLKRMEDVLQLFSYMQKHYPEKR